MGLFSFYKDLSGIGTSLCTSKRDALRIKWTNQLSVIYTHAVLLSVLYRVLTYATDRDTIEEHTVGAIIIVPTIHLSTLMTVMALNKYGYFNISRGCLVLFNLWSGILVAVRGGDTGYDGSTLLFIAAVLTFTLFDATFLKACIPLAGLTVGCYAYVRWEYSVNEQKGAEITIGILTLLIMSFCFHRLARENREHEEALERVVAGLKAEIAARELAEASLRKASQVKQDFLATMSHEIRTPMNGVIASSELLEDTPLNKEQQDLVNTLKSSSLALITIINDILDFSKIEAGKLTIESVPFNVREVVEEVLDCLSAASDEHGVELVADVAGGLLRDGLVLADPGRFRQLLLNLLGNAVKFTRNGSVAVRTYITSLANNEEEEGNSIQDMQASGNNGDIINTRDSGKSIGSYKSSFKSGSSYKSFSLECNSSYIEGGSVDRGGALLRVEVEDTGEGIKPEQLELLFQAFTQADTSTSRKHGGTGLGLAISSRLVSLMGGDIGVHSEVGKGSVFWFTMRVKKLAESSDVVRPFSGGEERGGGGGDIQPAEEALLILGSDPTGNNGSSGSTTNNGEGLIRSRSDPLQQQQQQQQQPALLGQPYYPTHPTEVLPTTIRGLAPAPPPQPLQQQQQQGRELVVVVWEPLAVAREALCGMLRHLGQTHQLLQRLGLQQQRQQQQQQQQQPDEATVSSHGGGNSRQVKLRLCCVESAEVSELVGALQEEAEGVAARRSTRVGGRGEPVGVVLICGNYSSLLHTPLATTTNGSPSDSSLEQQQQQQQQQREAQLRLGDVLQRLHAGVMLMGPRRHRAAVEADAGGCMPALPSIPGLSGTEGTRGSSTRRRGNEQEVRRAGSGVSIMIGAKGGQLYSIFHPPPTAYEGGSSSVWGGPADSNNIQAQVQAQAQNQAEVSQHPRSTPPSCSSSYPGAPWVYVSKPLHQSDVLEGLLLLLLTGCGGGSRSCGDILSRPPDISPTSSGTHFGDNASVAPMDTLDAARFTSAAAGGGGVGVEAVGKGRGIGALSAVPPIATTAEQAAGGAHVLVVEDNKVNQKMMGKMLTKLGVAFHIVENGALAVEAVKPQLQRDDDGGRGGGGGVYYSVVLMDCHMPVMDGYEATATIRQLEDEAGGGASSRGTAWAEEEEGQNGGGGGELVHIDAVPSSSGESSNSRRKSSINGSRSSSSSSSGSSMSRGPSSEHGSSRVPIIAVTASTLEEELQQCHDVGMDGVVAKPVRLRMIYDAVAPHISCELPPPVSSGNRERSSSSSSSSRLR